MTQAASTFLDEFLTPVAKPRDVLTLDLSGLEDVIAADEAARAELRGACGQACKGCKKACNHAHE